MTFEIWVKSYDVDFINLILQFRLRDVRLAISVCGVFHTWT